MMSPQNETRRVENSSDVTSNEPTQSEQSRLALQAMLPAFFADLDAEIAEATPVCQLSGRCCRFHEYGHTLFLSRIESEFLFKKPLPDEFAVDGSSCPYQEGLICTARENRPLGCRVYYCDPTYAGKGEAISERYIKQLKELHDENGVEWEYRPLPVFLREKKNND